MTERSRREVDLSYEVTVTTRYRVSAEDVGSVTRAQAQLREARDIWGHDPSAWPSEVAKVEEIGEAQAAWKIGHVDTRHARDLLNVEPPSLGAGSMDLGAGA